MKKITYEDKPVVIKILTESFKTDPHINWLLEKSKNLNKIKILMDYVFEESFEKGEIYLSDDKTAAALWNFEKGEKISFSYIIRNLSFLLRIGISATVRILKMDKLVHSHYPHEGKYSQLYLIGVLPESRGKGLASELMNPMIARFNNKSIPVYLETGNPRNVEIYKRKGFEIFNKIHTGGFTLFLMRG